MQLCDGLPQGAYVHAINSCVCMLSGSDLAAPGNLNIN